jgi:hypothetical protein
MMSDKGKEEEEENKIGFLSENEICCDCSCQMHLWTKPIGMVERFAVFVVLFSAKSFVLR